MAAFRVVPLWLIGLHRETVMWLSQCRKEGQMAPGNQEPISGGNRESSPCDLGERMRSEDWRRRMAAALAAGRADRDDGLREGLTAALTDAEGAVRWAAARALGERGDAAAVPLLSRALRDPACFVRAGAVRALGKLGHPVRGHLLRALSAGNEEDRAFACDAVTAFPDEPTVAALIRALKDESIRVRDAAAHALVCIGAPAVDLLIATLRGGDLGRRAQAARCLGKIGDPRACGPLERAIRCEASYVRKAAGQALKSLGCQPVAPALRDMDQPDPRVREAAARALAELADPQALEPFLRALEDPRSLVRFRAAEGLAVLRDAG